MKKGRLPLAELLANLPKYPPEGKFCIPIFHKIHDILTENIELEKKRK